MTTVLIIRPRGPHTSIHAAGTHFLETSLAQLSIKPSARAALSGLSVGAVVLEDLRVSDLDDDIRAALRAAIEGNSCPVVTRWTNPNTGNSL